MDDSGLNSLPLMVQGHSSGTMQASLYCTVPSGQKQPSLHLPLVGTTAAVSQVGSTSGPQGKYTRPKLQLMAELKKLKKKISFKFHFIDFLTYDKFPNYANHAPF